MFFISVYEWECGGDFVGWEVYDCRCEWGIFLVMCIEGFVGIWIIRVLFWIREM